MQRKLQHLIAIVAICTMWLMASAHPQSVPVSPFMPGDVNEDRIIDITDVSGIINFMIGGKDLSETQARNADFNHDGKIDIADINGVITLMLGNGYAHVQPMSLVVETRNGSRDVFPLADNPQLSFVGQEMLVKSSGATSYYNRNQLHQVYYMPYTQSQRIARAPRAPMTDNPNQYAIYIYRNDNDFNAHLNIDVESIRFSAVGTDSIWYDNPLVQEVWTEDTVFRTPIAAVDSITFQAPNPVLRNNLYIINEDNVGYVTYSDDNTIRFASATPYSNRPVLNQVIVSELFEGPVSDGFAGRVRTMKTLSTGEIEYMCDDVTFDDIFERFVLVAKATNNSDVPGRRVKPRHLFGLEIDEGEIITLDDVIPEVTLGYDGFPLSLKYHPVITVDYVLYVMPKEPTHIKLVISGDHTFTPQLKFEHKLGEVKETAWLYHENNSWTKPKPLEVPIGHGIKFMWNLGLFFKASGKVALKGSIPITVHHSLGIDYHGTNLDLSNVNFIHNMGLDVGQPNLDMSLSGSLAFGGAAQLGFSFIHRKLASISGTLNFGPKLSASLDLSATNYLDDQTLYSLLKDSKVKLDFNVGLDFDYMLLNKKFKMTPGQGWPGVKPGDPIEGKWDLAFEWDIPIKECRLLPTFTTPVINNYSNGTVTVSAQPSKDVFLPLQLGMGVYNQDGIVSEDFGGFLESLYWLGNSTPRQYTMSGLQPQGYYICRPLISFPGIDRNIIAAPVKEFSANNLSVSTQTVTVGVGGMQDVPFVGCSGEYVLTNINDDLAKATIDDGQLLIYGLKKGNTAVTLSDKETGERVTISVTVSDQPVDLALSTTSVQLKVGESKTVDVINGSGSYSVSSSDASVATATLQGANPKQILIKGIKAGTATITLTDKQTNQTATIAVTVGNETVITLHTPQPADGATVQGTSVHLTCEGWNYGDLFEIRLSDKASMSQILKKVRSQSLCTADFSDLTPNTTYYWQVARFDYDVEEWVVISPVWSFTTAMSETPQTQTFTVNGVSFTMVAVEGGTFTMGATAEQGDDGWGDEEPAHRVTLSSYHIGQTEVTQALWRAVMGDNPSCFKGDNLPVEQVSWHDCQTFISKLNELTGKNFRLPTEAEWEYAARGGNRSRGYKYAGGNNIGDVAWYGSNSGGKTHPVGTKAPNELGLYDMSGNVQEWCQDWFGSYNSGAQTNPTGPVSGSDRVLRGGCWFDYSVWYCRVSARGISTPTDSRDDFGLRLAL